MELDELRRHWERFGADDPLWAVLTAPDKKHGRWDVGEFFASGRFEVDRVLAAAERELGRAVRTDRALDFGCGVGRLSQALAERFDQVDGVDIAATMIDAARRFNRHGERCTYHLNTAPDLSLLADDAFDFAYTAHVLQHMEPRYAAGYVGELVRVLRPGGALVFQIPTEPVTGASAALPPSAYRATIDVLRGPTQLAAGSAGTVAVRVRNDAATTFPAAGQAGWFQVTAGNHWDDSTGRRLVVDDGRVGLPYDLEPGAEVVLELEVVAPARPGRFQLVVDLCQEGVSWFADRGSAVASRPVQVRRARRGLRRPGPADDPARMEMYGSAEATVTSWVEVAGGQVVAVLPWEELVDQRPAPDWVRRSFVVSKP